MGQPESAMTLNTPPTGSQWDGTQARSARDLADFDRLLAHDVDRLYRIAFRLLRNHEDAEDAVQEGLWKAFRRLPSFEGRSSLSTWVTRIVINSALMTLRSRKSHRGFSLDEMMENQVEAIALRAADNRPDPEQLCAAAEFMENAEHQLQKLPAPEQLAFTHYAINGYSTKESAWTFGVSVGTFKSRILRTRRKLARAMHHSINQAQVPAPGEHAIHDAQSQ